jgi:hypothetical protein
MCFWIADFFECGHTLEEIYNMCYWDYLDIVTSITERRSKQSNSSNPRELRPIQKSAIEKAKQIKK